MAPDADPADKGRGGSAPAPGTNGNGHRAGGGHDAVVGAGLGPLPADGPPAPGGGPDEGSPWVRPPPGFAAHRGTALGGGPAFAPVDDEGPPGADETDEPDGAPARRRPRWVRVVGLVIALALVLASIGTGVGIILGGPSGSALTSVVDSVGPAAGHQGGPGLEEVTLTLANASSGPVTPVCTVWVRHGGVTIGSVAARGTHPLGASDRVSATVLVPVDRQPFVGTAADARATCTG